MALGRFGLIGKKLGMTQVFAKGGELVPVTVILAGPCTVMQKRTGETDGYSAVQLGFGETKAQRLTKAEREHRKKAGKMASVLREFRGGAELEVGAEVKVGDLFKEGDLVDVTGVSKGYQGVIRATLQRLSGDAQHAPFPARRQIGCAHPGRVQKQGWPHGR
jgi:large subunit ribosomal protein L3